MGTTKSGGIRCRRSRLAFGACALLLLAACGDDGDDSPTDETADEPADGADGQSDGMADLEDALLEDCLLTADEVSDVVGGQVTNEGFSFGGAASGSSGFSADTDSIEVTQDEDYNIAWQSCEYTATDGSGYEVGLLITEDQEPTVEGFEQLVSYAETAVEDQVPPDVGDEGFYGDEEIVVRSGDVTLVVGFGRGSSDGQDEATAHAAFEDMAGAAIDAGLDDEPAACSAAAQIAMDEWGDLGDPLHGSGAAGSADAPYEYTRCSLQRDDGLTVELSFGDAEMYDILASDNDDGQPPELVTGLGDAAVSADGVLYIRVGETAVMVAALDAEGEPVEDTDVDALAGAVISAVD